MEKAKEYQGLTVLTVEGLVRGEFHCRCGKEVSIQLPEKGSYLCRCGEAIIRRREEEEQADILPKFIEDKCDGCDYKKMAEGKWAISKEDLQPKVQEGDRVRAISIVNPRGSTNHIGKDITLTKALNNGDNFETDNINELIFTPEYYHYKLLPYWTEERIKPKMWVAAKDIVLLVIEHSSDRSWELVDDMGNTTHHGKNYLIEWLSECNYRLATPEQIREWVKA